MPKLSDSMAEALKAFNRVSDDTNHPRKIPKDIAAVPWEMSPDVEMDEYDKDKPLTTHCTACEGKFINYKFTLRDPRNPDNVLTDCGGCCGVKLCKGDAKKAARAIKKEVYAVFPYLQKIRDQNRFNHSEKVFRVSTDKRTVTVHENGSVIETFTAPTLLSLARLVYRYVQTLGVHIGKTRKSKTPPPKPKAEGDF